MDLGTVKSILHRVDMIIQTIRPEDRQTYIFDHRADGTTVTWRINNAVSPQNVYQDVETAAIWLWSLKDYLKERIASTGGDPRIVEAHVDSSEYLPLLADVANTAKHGKLNRSRSGRYAHLSGSSLLIPSGLHMRGLSDKDADVELTLADPDGVDYKVDVSDQHDKYIGDGLVVLRNALDEWRSFIQQQPTLRPMLR